MEAVVESKLIVSTGDINKPYEIIGPVYFQVSNKPEGFSTSVFQDLKDYYVDKIDRMKASGELTEGGQGSSKWACMWGEWCLGKSNFDIAFFIAVEELKKRAHMLGADGIIFMRQDIDFDIKEIQFFYLQMYGTAVRFV